MNGETRARIANEIVRLQSEYYGKGPTKARCRIDADVIVVVLEGTFTLAERTLIERTNTPEFALAEQKDAAEA